MRTDSFVVLRWSKISSINVSLRILAVVNASDTDVQTKEEVGTEMVMDTETTDRHSPK